jgi:hypothetical protein
VPTANSADSGQPFNQWSDNPLRAAGSPRGNRRIALAGLGLLLGASLALPMGTVLAPAADAAANPRSKCSTWTRTDRPPDYIRVLRRKSGRIERVPFRKYVVTVMGKEWPSYLPQQVVEAGAVAVKQYGWYHAMGRARITRDGRCFDVRDGTGDQLYKPGKARVRPDHYAALDKTWNVRLIKNGKLFMTGYRRGGKAGCGRDKTGWKLYAMSAKRCAWAGYDFKQILRKYYSPNLQLIDAPYGRGSAAQQRNSEVAAETTRTVDDRSRAVNFSGGWRRANPRSAVNDTLTTSTKPGATARFRFVGDSLELIGRRGPNRGKLDVYVNGTRVARINTYANRKRDGLVLLSKQWRRERSRVVVLVAVGSHTPHVSVDAIRVH